MFAKLLKSLTAPRPRPLSAPDSRLALAALMVRIARADGDYAPAEIASIEHILARRYGLSREEAARLRSDAERLEAEAPDTVRFTRAIKAAVPHEERLAVVEALWEVVLADGTRDNAENNLLRLLANLLGINDRDSAIARQRVQARLP